MNLPSKWSEVRLKQYIDIVELSYVDMDDLDRSAKILSILSKEKEDVILDLPLTTIKKYNRIVSFIYTKPEGGVLRHTKRIGMNRYKVNYQLSDLTGSEYIDLTGFTKDKTKTISNMASIIAIFFKPINWIGFEKKGCYDKGIQTTDSRIKTAKDLENLPMDEVAALSGFFLKSFERLTKATLDSITKQNMKTEKKLKKMLKRVAS